MVAHPQWGVLAAVFKGPATLVLAGVLLLGMTD
jgi:hypothetical protein